MSASAHDEVASSNCARPCCARHEHGHSRKSARRLWSYQTYGWALRGWNKWLSWASRCRLKPMVKVAETIKNHLWGILNAAVTGLSNATAEPLNAGIQRLKKRACGYRSRDKFRIAITDRKSKRHCGMRQQAWSGRCRSPAAASSPRCEVGATSFLQVGPASVKREPGATQLICREWAQMPQ
jgi:Transposase